MRRLQVDARRSNRPRFALSITVLISRQMASVPRSVERPLDTNAACATGTLMVLDEARRAGVRRVIYAGSSSAHGDRPGSPKRETDLPVPISPYGAAKLAGKACWATYGLETVAIRYFNVFGPRQVPHSQYSAVIPTFITALLAGRRSTAMVVNPATSRKFPTWCTAISWLLALIPSSLRDVHLMLPMVAARIC